MPWKDYLKMDQRNEFAIRALKTDNFTQLCHEYGISRKTGYKWRDRFLSHGIEGMAETSRRPNHHPDALPEHTVCEIIRLKTAHPAWGPLKIQALYQRKHPELATPSESSFKRILQKAGLTIPRKKRRRSTDSGRIHSGRKASTSNEIWSIDFKGWWKDKEGLKVEPLTVRDEHSRLILDIRLMENTRTETVQAAFERLFEIHGLPSAIRSDNGPPFACSNSLLGLSRLSVWWLALGIDLERSRPGCPQDNGAHERMHLDIMRELQQQGVGRDQATFDTWRHEYNTLRPHSAINMKTPSELYTPSPRPHIGTPDEIDYNGLDTRRVHPRNGTISFEGELYKLTASLCGWQVGLRVRGNHIEVWFANQLLGHIDPSTATFIAARPGGNEGDNQPENL